MEGACERQDEGRERMKHSDGARLRVAVVGAGWTGLQVAQQLRARLPGVQVEIFERLDDVGGTWHPALAYHGLHLHGPVWLTEFEGYPYPDPGKQFEKLSAPEVLAYVQGFAEHHRLRESITFHAAVEEVHYDSQAQEARIQVRDTRTGTLREEGPYDLVLFATLAAGNAMPELPGLSSFQGQAYHSSMIKEEVFERIVAQGKKVVVVGGNKSAADQVIAFHEAGHRDVSLLHRELYWFLNYERVMARPEGPGDYARGAGTLLGLLLTGLWGPAGLSLLASLGSIYTPGPAHRDARRFHVGVLDAAQRRALEATPKVRGSAAGFAPQGLRLEEGRVLEAEVVIFGTGYQTGLEGLVVKADGRRVPLTEGLHHHILVPEAPRVVLAPAAFYTFGIKRGVCLAEHLLHFLQRGFPSPQEARQGAARHQMRANPIRMSLFSSQGSFMGDMLALNRDLIREGVLSPQAFVEHWWSMCVLRRQPALHLRGS